MGVKFPSLVTRAYKHQQNNPVQKKRKKKQIQITIDGAFFHILEKYPRIVREAAQISACRNLVKP